jgi:hydroxyacylglutathione hydrolase
MIIKVFSSGPLDTNAYILASEKTKTAWIIDAPLESAGPILSYLKNNDLTCEKIILTHSHWDHIADVETLKRHLSVLVAVHADDKDNLIDPGSDGLPLYFAIDASVPDEILVGGETLKLSEIEAKVIHTPGHSEGSICLYIESQKCLISGDTLFKGSMGRVDLPTSDPEKMWSSLLQLSTLPPETAVYPGHGEMTTIGRESWMKNAKELFS